MGTNITHVTVSIHVKPTTKSHIIVVKQAITNGAGQLEEVIQGGDVKYDLKLTTGHSVIALQKNENVWVSGVNPEGDEISLPIALQVVTAHRPWHFKGDNGGNPGVIPPHSRTE